MSVRYTYLDPSYWSVSGNNLHNNNLLNQNLTAFVLNPVTVATTLGGSKTSTFTPAQVDANFKSVLTSTTTIPNAANFTVATFLANGWTTGDQDLLVKELGAFFMHNLGNTTTNPGINDLNLIIAIGNIQGTDYLIPFSYIGDQGTPVSFVDDVYGDMLFTDVTFEFLYGNSQFTDTNFNLTIDGGVW